MTDGSFVANEKTVMITEGMCSVGMEKPQRFMEFSGEKRKDELILFRAILLPMECSPMLLFTIHIRPDINTSICILTSCVLPCIILFNKI